MRDHDDCGNCLEYAMLWRQRLVDRLDQGSLWEDDETSGYDPGGLALPGQLPLPRELVLSVSY